MSVERQLVGGGLGPHVVHQVAGGRLGGQGSARLHLQLDRPRSWWRDRRPPGQRRDRRPPGQRRDRKTPGQRRDRRTPGQRQSANPPSLASRVLLLLELGQAGSVDLELAVLDEGAVALGVGEVPGGLAVGADEGPEDGTGDEARVGPELVAPALLLRLSIGQAELAHVTGGLHCPLHSAPSTTVDNLIRFLVASSSKCHLILTAHYIRILSLLGKVPTGRLPVGN